MLARPQPQNSSIGARAWLAALLSVAGHGVAVGAFVALSSVVSPPRKPARPATAIRMRTIDAKTWATNQGRFATSRRQEPDAPLHPKGQVVDVAPGNNQLAPDAKYLAETNNRVQRETRAKEQTNKYSRATPKTSATPEALPAAKGAQTPQLASAVAVEERVSDLGSRVRLTDRLTVGSAHPSLTAEPTEERPGMETGTVPAVGGDSSEGGGAPNDDLGNVAQGDGTYLNTREWKYAAFFNRVKHAITARWDPNGRLRGRSVGFADRVTVVGVTLRPDGSLADAYVAKSSGVDVLDHEAIAAFERAQPFLNPPPQLVEAGYIRFTFGFTLSTETSLGSPNFFRVGR